MVNDVIGGHVTSNFLKKICKNFLFSSKNIRQHFFVKYVKTKHCFGPNGRKNHKIYHRENYYAMIRKSLKHIHQNTCLGS